MRRNSTTRANNCAVVHIVSTIIAIVVVIARFVVINIPIVFCFATTFDLIDFTTFSDKLLTCRLTPCIHRASRSFVNQISVASAPTFAEAGKNRAAKCSVFHFV